MTKFEETNLGLKVMEQELALLLAAACAKMEEIATHRMSSKKRRADIGKQAAKVRSFVPDRTLVSLDQSISFTDDVQPVLKNIVIRKAEDHDEP